MKNLQIAPFFFILLCTLSISAQEKLKGNREVSTEDRNLSEFTKIEVIDNVEVLLNFNNDQSVEVETDSNLQSAVLTEVNNGTLTIKTSTKIIRKKTLKIHIKVNQFIEEINTYNSAKVSSNNSLIIDTLTLNSYDNSDLDLRLNSKLIHINAKKMSKLKLAVLSTNAFVRSEENSKIIATIDTQDLIATTIGKSTLSLNGTATHFELESYGDTSVKGKEFKCNSSVIKVSNNADATVNALETIEIYATNSSKIYLYSNPKITISEFFDKASIYKRDLDKKLF